ncbi:MAG: precorrin-2 dehydrogenase/sirohydrochlorin ferrochelatase family protein, partial [Candidatus Binatia bacterium]
GDLKASFLVYDATADPRAHKRIVSEARDAGVLINVVDRPQLCDFIAPAVVRRGDLLIAVSTGGASPALAKKVRRRLERSFGPEYEEGLRLLAALRGKLRQSSLSALDRQKVLSELVNSRLLQHVKRREKAKVDRLLSRAIGRGWNLHRLGVKL